MPATASEPRLGALLAAVAAALALLAGLAGSSAWQALEWRVFDAFTALAAPRQGDPRIVILAIDEPSFQQLQRQWPFPRSLHGRLLERLHADGARAVGFDVVFAEPGPPAEDQAFADAIRRGGPVVLAQAQELLEDANATLWTEVPPLQEFLDAGARAGDIGVQPEDDYVVRRHPAGEATLAAQLALAAGLPLAPAPDLIEYLGPRGTIETRSYYQALEPGLLPPGFFRDRIVLVGRSTRTAVELQSRADIFNSPFAGGDRLLPGVEIQATLLANRLSGGGLKQLAPGWSIGLLLALAALLLASGRRLHPAGGLALAGASAAGTLALSGWLFVQHKLWLAPLLPVSGLLVVQGATVLFGWLTARQRAQQVRRMFAQYVPGPVVERLVEQPELLRLGGQTREVTLMFTDLAGFTTLSEQLSPEQTVEVLTAYFDTMTPIIHRHQGTVDKFIGDAIMAFWGAPLRDARHAEHAMRAAIEMQAAMDQLVAGLQARGLPPIAMRVGLHTGSAVIGNVGSASRFSYTAIGDAVNLAARLEGANKAFGSQVLLSQATAAQLPPDILLRPLDDVIVKGKSEPVRVYTPCTDAALRQASDQALAAFHARRWAEARLALATVLALRPGDLAARRLLERITEAEALPPEAVWSPAVALDKL